MQAGHATRPRLRALYYSNTLLWTFIVIGWGLRIRWYFFNRSLWFDEAAVALNLLHEPVASLLVQLDSHQPAPAPIGFLLGARLLTSILGDGEYALRLLPFLCGMAALPLFCQVAKRYASPAVVPLALAFFAISPTSIDYTIECKPYMIDLVLTLAVLWMAAWISKGAMTPRRALGFSLLGAIALWCSYPMVFVLAGVGAALGVGCVLDHDWRRLGRFAAVCAGWALSFAAYYLVSLSTLSGNALLKELWSGYFLSVSDLTLTRRVFSAVFIYPLDLVMSRGWLLIPLFFLGWVVRFARERTLSLVLIAPIVVTAAVSALGIYPFYGRLLLFSVPLFLLPTSAGTVQIAEWAARARPSAGIVTGIILASLLATPSVTAIARGPQEVNELRPLIAYIGEHAAPDDTIYVGEFAPVYEYYAPRFGLTKRPYVTGRYFDAPWAREDVATLDALRGTRRVWMVSGTPEVWQHMDSIATRILSMPKTGAMLVLYDVRSQSGAQ